MSKEIDYNNFDRLNRGISFCASAFAYDEKQMNDYDQLSSQPSHAGSGCTCTVNSYVS